MGKTRKTSKQKSDAKLANLENMKFMESLELIEMPAAPTPRKKARGSNIPPAAINNPPEGEPYVPEEDITRAVLISEKPCPHDELAAPEDLTVNSDKLPTVHVVSDTPEDLRQPGALAGQPTYAGRDVSVIKVVLDSADAEDAADAADRDAAQQLENRVEALQCENDTLRQENDRLRSLNMRLQEALIERPNSTTFSEIPGFPDAKWLLSVSQISQDSDYLFIKELMIRLFPFGVGNATVTGHGSNNPLGRGVKGALESGTPGNVEKLDPMKVAYIRDRLYERRMVLQDELGVAIQRSRKTTRLIAAVINNNPSLRNLRQE